MVSYSWEFYFVTSKLIILCSFLEISRRIFHVFLITKYFYYSLARVCSSFIISIALVTVISWFRGTGVTYFPDTYAGDKKFDYFSKVVSIESLDMVMAKKYDFSAAQGSNYVVALITLLYVNFLDTSGTLLAMVSLLSPKR